MFHCIETHNNHKSSHTNYLLHNFNSICDATEEIGVIHGEFCGQKYPAQPTDQYAAANHIHNITQPSAPSS